MDGLLDRYAGLALWLQSLIALAGLVVVVAFIGFGLTQSMLRDARGLAGYLGLVTACWCLLRVHKRDAILNG